MLKYDNPRMYIMSMKKELDMNIDAKSFYIPMTLLVFGYAFAVFACPDVIALLSFVPFYSFMFVAFLRVEDERKETGLFLAGIANVVVSVILSVVLLGVLLGFIPMVRSIAVTCSTGAANLAFSVVFLLLEAVHRSDLFKIPVVPFILFSNEK